MAELKKYSEGIFYGDLDNDKRQGKGIIVYSEYKVFVGEWENDKPTDGVLWEHKIEGAKHSHVVTVKGKEVTVAHNSEVTGHNQYTYFSDNNSLNGYGVIEETVSSSPTYDGSYLRGDLFVGEFKNGKCDGYVYRNLNGVFGIKCSLGLWKDGEIIEEQKEILTF